MFLRVQDSGKRDLVQQTVNLCREMSENLRVGGVGSGRGRKASRRRGVGSGGEGSEAAARGQRLCLKNGEADFTETEGRGGDGPTAACGWCLTGDCLVVVGLTGW
ncbi:DNA gyrase subunit A [Striga asiatica]|uniref:DNA gyrase subunit A n=1 Tax=Striga asiatica TaxID=4170 RepID=A0A5A7QH42_STRAF|nr:DNA gyrase subunit A [Striga asiatica]